MVHFLLDKPEVDPVVLPSMSYTENTKHYKNSDLSRYQRSHPVSADQARVDVLFHASVERAIKWDVEKLESSRTWITQIWKLAEDVRAQNMYCKYRILHPQFPAEAMGRPTQSQDEIQRVKFDLNLYSEIQRIILSVTDSLDQTSGYSVVIYGLGRLAEMLADTTCAQTKCYDMGVLLKFMAPVAPTLAEECWEELHLDTTHRNADLSELSAQDIEARSQLAKAYKGSIFQESYPVASGMFASKHPLQHCVVLEDGLPRFVAVIPVPNEDFVERLDPFTLRDWVLKHVQTTEEWCEFLRTVPEERRRRVVVGRAAKTVSFLP